jgi:aminoglycoside phosphotransferase (APT) family kinase protein
LFDKLRTLGWFLAELHNNSARQERVAFDESVRYFNCIVENLSGIISDGEAAFLCQLRDIWQSDWAMWSDCKVLVHGDATPANFFFGQGLYVISFDLERMSRSDRLFDTGRIAGELKHFFLFHTKNKYAAEPFIKHFIWEYSCHFPDREQAFRSITARLPFYMGKTLLRIARNTYLNHQYRRQLIEEAKLTLQRS